MNFSGKRQVNSKVQYKKLYDQIEELKINLINERNIVEKFKKIIKDKENDYFYLQQRLGQQIKEHAKREEQLEKDYLLKKKSL